MTELCRAYGISRPTGYALWRRYQSAGEAGLEERSRAAAIEDQVLELRRAHMRWERAN